MNTIEKINLILKKTNISKVNLAKYLGVSRQMVYNYLDGEDLSKMPAEKCQNFVPHSFCQRLIEMAFVRQQRSVLWLWNPHNGFPITPVP